MSDDYTGLSAILEAAYRNHDGRTETAAACFQRVAKAAVESLLPERGARLHAERLTINWLRTRAASLSSSDQQPTTGETEEEQEIERVRKHLPLERCGAQSPGSYWSVCSLYKDHKGQHIAFWNHSGRDGECCPRWPRLEQPPEQEKPATSQPTGSSCALCRGEPLCPEHQPVRRRVETFTELAMRPLERRGAGSDRRKKERRQESDLDGRRSWNRPRRLDGSQPQGRRDNVDRRKSLDGKKLGRRAGDQ